MSLGDYALTSFAIEQKPKYLMPVRLEIFRPGIVGITAKAATFCQDKGLVRFSDELRIEAIRAVLGSAHRSGNATEVKKILLWDYILWAKNFLNSILTIYALWPSSLVPWYLGL